jgi:DNA repair exonuclease SbcCD ATPase subunit
MELTERIQQHAGEVAGLRAELDAVIEQMEEKTADATQKLREYQRRKSETEAILDAAGYSFIEAEKLLSRLDGLLARMTALSREQRKLDRAAMGLDAEPQQLGELREELRNIGAEVHELRMYRGWCRPTAGAQKAMA